jgi:hypothetical protein
MNLVTDFVSTLKQIESTVVGRIHLAGIKDNEITDNNDSIVQNEVENIIYRNNTIHAVFYEVYGPMRGSKPLNLKVHQEYVSVNKNLINVYVITLGEGLITLAEGKVEIIDRLLQALTLLVSDESIKNLVKHSYKEGRRMFRGRDDETFVLDDYPWIPRSFKADIRRSPRDELTS